jgi:hypothetical protein
LSPSLSLISEQYKLPSLDALDIHLDYFDLRAPTQPPCLLVQ